MKKSNIYVVLRNSKGEKILQKFNQTQWRLNEKFIVPYFRTLFKNDGEISFELRDLDKL